MSHSHSLPLSSSSSLNRTISARNNTTEQTRSRYHSRGKNSSLTSYHGPSSSSSSSPSSTSFPPSSFPLQQHHVVNGSGSGIDNYSPPRPLHPAAHPESSFRNAQQNPARRSYHNPDQPPTSLPPSTPPHRRSLNSHTPSSTHNSRSYNAHNRSSSVDDRTSQIGHGVVNVNPSNYPGDRQYPRSSVDGQDPFRSNNTPRSSRASQNLSAMAADPSYGAPGSARGSWHHRRQDSSSSSNYPFATGPATPGTVTPGIGGADGSRYSLPLQDYNSVHAASLHSPYQDSPYHNSSLSFGPQAGQGDINPNNIVDDDDDGFIPDSRRKSTLGQGERGPSPSSGAVAGAAGAGGIMAALGGLLGRKQKEQASNVAYDPVGRPDHIGSGSVRGLDGTKEGALSTEKHLGPRKKPWLFYFLIGLVIMLAVVAAILGAVFGTRSAATKSGGRPSRESINNAEDDLAANGDLGKDSREIQALMDNPDLHKVFPAMDYNPWGVQYPECLTWPPSQNNVTRDMAILTQLTDVVRLYGTDCNQTEMVLHAIDRLELDSMKVWLGVWIGTNQTTNNRQLRKMYEILEDTDKHDIFKGAIVGNEALYRAEEADKAQSQRELIQTMEDVRSNFSKLSYEMPVTTSDLGDNWNAELVDASDSIMSNIHPFFAGVPADEAAAWTWTFWRNKNDPLVKGKEIDEIISETGWPSGGGTDCGPPDNKCSKGEEGAEAGVDEMNIFMEDFVCQALENGTEYFWFEAFDEPWKVKYNEPGQEWEDKWGLLDADRHIKPGLKIPDCGGKKPA